VYGRISDRADDRRIELGYYIRFGVSRGAGMPFQLNLAPGFTTR
jgi:hypothetical protein